VGRFLFVVETAELLNIFLIVLMALFYTLIIIKYAEISKIRCPRGVPEGEAEFQAANSTLAGFRFNLSNQNEFVFLCESARLKYPREKHEQLNPSVWYSWT